MYYIEDGKPVNKLTVSAKARCRRSRSAWAGRSSSRATRRSRWRPCATRSSTPTTTRWRVDWLQKWRDAGAKGDFRVWLGSQPIALADRQLIGERVEGGSVNTEVLAHLEGFIMAFPKEDHEKANPQRSVYDQLTGVAEHWGSASTEIKAEAVKRILEMKKAQKGPALAALKAAFTRLKDEKDAPKALVDAVLSARG